jgi:hypothetical protein
VFHFSVLCCSQSGNHPENVFAKFGYTSNMKGFKEKYPYMILAYLLEQIIKIRRFGNFFIKIK